MIASDTSVKALASAITAAVLVHGVLLWWLSGEAEVEVEGAPGAAQVQLGTSFADMAAGSLSAEAPEEVTEPTEVQEVLDAAETPDRAEPVETDTQVTHSSPREPLRTEPVTTTQPVATPETAQHLATPLDVAVALQPLTPTVPVETAQTPQPPEPAEAPEPVPPAEEIVAAEEVSPAVSRSLRPQNRSKDFEEKHKPEPVQRTQTTQKKTTTQSTQKKSTQPQGNANQNARAGSTTGSNQSQAKSSSSGQGQQAATGNAAASNYPGKVMRKISRVPKPRVGQRGTAVVAFRISANGGLSGLSLARSSGSSALDEAALRVIRRAAPFPPPPQGARRSFSISIKGR